MRAPGPRREALLVTAALAVLYLLTLTGNHAEAEDAINYANGLEEGLIGQALHPHHLLWGGIGWIVHNVALALGREAGTLGELQAMNAVVGAAGLGFLWWWLRTLGLRPAAVALGCGVLAFSYGYWFYAGEAEVYVLGAALLIVCLAAAHRAVARPSLASFAALGAANALAVLAHDTNVLFAAVALAALLVSRADASAAELLRRATAYAFVAAAIVVPAYAAAALANGQSTPAQAYDWVSGYASNDEWGKLEASSVPKALVGGGRALVGGHAVFANDSTRDIVESLGSRNPREELFLMRDYPGGLGAAILALAALVLALFGTAIVRAVRARHALTEDHRALAVLCLAWFGMYAAFFTWWEPINVEFWIAPAIPVAILLALGASARPFAREPLFVAALVAGLALANLVGSILPAQDEDDDYWRVRSEWYADNTTRSDLVITNNYVQKGYVAYFAPARAEDAGDSPPAEVAAFPRTWPGTRVIASQEAFFPDADEYSSCDDGRSCRLARVLRPRLLPGARVIGGGPWERVYLLRRPSPPERGAP